LTLFLKINHRHLASAGKVDLPQPDPSRHADSPLRSSKVRSTVACRRAPRQNVTLTSCDHVAFVGPCAGGIGIAGLLASFTIFFNIRFLNAALARLGTAPTAVCFVRGRNCACQQPGGAEQVLRIKKPASAMLTPKGWTANGLDTPMPSSALA